MQRKGVRKNTRNSPPLVDAILSADVLKRAEEELKFIKKESIQQIFYGDKDSPNRLKQCEDAPLNLFFKGVISSLRGKVYKKNI